MEFVIVAPLYFLLLGGLFYVGEFFLNRLLLNESDAFVTWSVGSRLIPDKTSVGPNLANWLFDANLEMMKLAVDVGPNSLDANAFCRLYAGGVEELELSVPDWIRGMMSMAAFMSGKRQSDFASVKTHAFFSVDDTYCRSASIHRRGDVPTAYDRSRSVPACDLLCREYLQNVLSDSWIENSSEYEGNATLGGDHGGYINRQMIQWGE